jgi:tetratricopeptide (TPR) repeat protein
MDEPTVSMRNDAPGFASAPMPQAWGPFQLLEKVGEGSFGEVYRARDTKLEREVAVKLLRTGDSAETDYSTVIREARLMARVRHPNIVSVYGVERYDNRVGLWTDFVRGKTLSHLLRVQGPFGARESALIGIELCRALSAMHSAGLLHRDIKTSNAMREEGGRILLMDFGLSGEFTGQPALGGTRGYIAPELYRGAPASVASDIYAMGVLLFHLASGRYPDEAPGPRRRLIDERPDLPESFTRVVERAIAADPDQRFPSAGAILSALSDSLGASPAAPLDSSPPRKRRFWMRPLVALLILAGAGGYAYFKLNHTHEEATGLASGANEDYMRAMDLLKRDDKPGNPDQAMTLLEKVIAANPKSALAHSGIARAFLAKFNATRDPAFSEKARVEAQKALELDNSLASVHVTAGNVYLRMARYDLAANEFQQAIKLDATSAEAQAGLASLYQAQGRIADVLPTYQKAIDLGPDDARWPIQLGNFYLSKGKNAEAAEQYQNAVKLSPDNAFAYANLGIALRRQEHLVEAESAMRKAVNINPNSPRILSSLGTVLLMEGKYRDAAGEYSKAVNLAPSDYLTHANLAAAYQWGSFPREKAKQEWLTTIDLAEKERKARPRDPLLLASLGSYYAAVGQPGPALPLLRQAVALAPDDPSVLIAAGEGFEIIGHRKEAIDVIAKALDLGYSPGYVERSPDLVELRKDPKFLARSGKVR